MEWFENEDFWEHTYPVMFREPLWERAGREVDKVLALAQHAGGPVLDFCCGPGRHLIALAKRGIKTTGVDVSAFLLSKARELAREQDVDVELVHQDVRTFVRRGEFEVALSMFTSFGYFEDRSEDIAVLHNMRESLRPGGKAIVDILGKEIWSQHYPANYEGPDVQLRVSWEALENWSKIMNHWVVRNAGRELSHSFTNTLYSGLELKEAMEIAGFSDVCLFGSYDGAPYDHLSTRLIAMGSAPIKR